MTNKHVWVCMWVCVIFGVTTRVLINIEVNQFFWPRDCHIGNCTRLQFRTWRFETLINWMEGFCANEVLALQDLAAEDSKSNKLMPGDFF